MLYKNVALALLPLIALAACNNSGDDDPEVEPVRVFDVFDELVWEKLDVPRVTGSKNVEVPALEKGFYYQFRAISWKTPEVGISATEDLKGVFIAG